MRNLLGIKVELYFFFFFFFFFFLKKKKKLFLGLPTAFYNESHVAWRARVRKFVEEELKPHVSEWEEKENSMPIKELCKKMVAAGIYGAAYPKEYGGGGGLDNYDAFHGVIFADELARTGSGGVTTALNVGVGIGLGPVLAGGRKRRNRKKQFNFFDMNMF